MPRPARWLKSSNGWIHLRINMLSRDQFFDALPDADMRLRVKKKATIITRALAVP